MEYQWITGLCAHASYGIIRDNGPMAADSYGRVRDTRSNGGSLV